MKKIYLALVLSCFLLNVEAQKEIELPLAQKTGGMSLMEALSKRSTARAFDSKELSLQQISDLLWAAFGINRPDGKRTAPSARNFQETDLYVFLKSGVYIYDAKLNRLKQVIAEDVRNLGGVQGFIKDAPMHIILIADLSKIKSGKLDEKLNTAYIDGGYISQNIYLFCASAGLVTGARQSVDVDALTQKLNLSSDQHIIIAHSVGYSK